MMQNFSNLLNLIENKRPCRFQLTTNNNIDCDIIDVNSTNPHLGDIPNLNNNCNNTHNDQINDNNITLIPNTCSNLTNNNTNGLYSVN